MKPFFFLIPIIVFAFFLRIYGIGDVPAGMNRDEVGMGYDAYSILKTGRDQFGAFLPLTLRSSDDYKPALYTYTIIPFIPVFGLNAVSVRLPSILFGTLTVLVVYVLTQVLLNIMKGPTFLFRKVGPSITLPLLSAFFLAVSPWHIQYSRGAFEANAALFFVTAGVWLFLRGISQKRTEIQNVWNLVLGSWEFLLSGGCFGLSLLTYHSARFMTPVLILMLLLLFHREVAVRWRQVLVFLVIVAAFFAMILPSIVSPETQVRYRALSIFSKEAFLDVSARDIFLDEQAGAGWWGRIFHNRRLIPFTHDALAQFAENYVRHFNPADLIFGRNGPRLQQVNHAPDSGVVYPWEAVLALIGIGVLILSHGRVTFFLLGWLLLAFVPAAITYDMPSYVRSIFALPVVQIFAAVGAVAAVSWGMRQSRFLTWVGIAVVSIGLLTSFAFFLHQYFVHLNVEEAEDWRFGRKEAAHLVWEKRSQYDRIIVSTLLDDPHLHFLFHLKIDPAWYLAQGGTKSGGWTATENRLENIEFRRFTLSEVEGLSGQGEMLEQMKEGILYVGLAKEFPPIRPPSPDELERLRASGSAYLSVVDEISFPNGKPFGSQGKPGILLVEKLSKTPRSQGLTLRSGEVDR
ncbi:MAG: hypothetical protein Q8R11_02930 [bacterium]|nr:hypothetical protein [bacterium]